MAENSKIEWTTHTFNPWIGCQKVSPGCDHCYAETMMERRYHRVEWGPHGERKRTSAAYWRQPTKWAKSATAAVRPRVFCASLADWLDNRVPNEWRRDLAELIAATPQLDWLLLTKRPENFDKHAPWPQDDVPANVWLGITAEDQARFDARWPHIRGRKAHRHFISYEPGLGPLHLPTQGDIPDWIICGGESGPGKRPFDLEWARLCRDECRERGVAFFMKQIDKVKPIPADLMIREIPQ
jgi:protein gp37